MSEAVLRLRRLRGLTQEQLAERMGTKQPAIARLERGHDNTTLKTLVAVAEALDATVRIDLDPVELLGREPRHARWWERMSAPTVMWHALSPAGTTVCVTTSVWAGPGQSRPNGLPNPTPPAVVADAFASLVDQTTSDWLARSTVEAPAAPPSRRVLQDMAASLG